MKNTKNLHNKILNIIRLLLLIITSLVIGINLYYLNAIKILGDPMPMPNGYGVAVILSGSMEPTLEIDDLIIVEKKETYHKNDIVVFQRKNELIVHRIIEINNNEVITKGDANTAHDTIISIKDIKGKVNKRIPNVGIIINFIKSPLGILIIISITIFVYTYSSLKEQKQEKNELNEIRKEIEKLKQQT